MLLPLCFFVKEGEYPPPKAVRRPEGPLLKRPAEWIGIYFRQCYRHWFFTFLFLGTALNNASTVCRSTFNLLFATRELQMTAGQFGKVMAAGAVVSAGVVVLTGFLMDRLHPLRVFVASGVIVVAANVWGYFGVVDYPTFFVVGIAISVVYAVQFVSNGPVFIELFPPDKFGQFSSANAMMNSILLIFANYFGGVAIDRFGYRFIFIWDTIFTVAAALALLFVYVRWKQLFRSGCPAVHRSAGSFGGGHRRETSPPRTEGRSCAFTGFRTRLSSPAATWLQLRCRSCAHGLIPSRIRP